MDFKRVNYIVAGVILLICSVVYIMTMQPNVSFWDCGEFIGCAYTLSIPHPPGAPLWILVGKVATMMPFGDNPAVKMNALAAVSAGFSVMFLYLVIVIVIKNWRGAPKNNWDAVMIFGAAFIGALSFGFSDSAWFNAMESEVYALGTMLVGLCIWLIMYWWEKADSKGNEKILLLIAYVVGLSLGIHLLVVQVILIAGLVYYFRKFEYNRKTFLIAFLISCGAFIVVYPVTVIWYPTWLSGDIKSLNVDGSSFVKWLAILIIPAILYGIYWAYQNKKKIWAFSFIGVFLVFSGYTIYTSVLIRANVDNLPINENDPHSMERLVSYLSREQYGDAPFWPRRYSQEPMHRRTWANYTSDFDFLWRYQINHMFNRYLGWQYIGRAGYNQDQGIDWSKFYGIPFLIGLFGLFYHFRKDWKLGLIFLWAFLLMGIFTALFQRQQDPQPRERDYFYSGAFFVYSLWIGLGTMGIMELIKDSIKGKQAMMAAGIASLAVLFVLIPGKMFSENYHYNNRHNNYVPFDYAYNILQSVESDAIIFTNGDNDTFPLWYLQAIGYRQDIRVVNLSLLNVDWYIKEMKNEMPYGAKKVPINMTDAQVEKVQPTQWGEYKVVSVGVPPEAYPDSIRAKGTPPDKITWRMPATVSFQNIKAVKTQDLMIYEIVKSNNWERPVYFSSTVTDDNYIGLDEYLVTEGMSKRLVPFKNERVQFRVNEKTITENMMSLPSEHSKTPQRGMFFRSFNDPDIFFDQVHSNIVQNYRTQYLTFSYAMYSENKFDKVAEILDRMEQNLPLSVVPMDYRIQYDVAMMYLRIGNNDKFNELSVFVEQSAIAEMQRNPNDISTYWNPYKILIDIYEGRDEYGKAIDILTRLDRLSPGSPEVKMKIQMLQQKLQNN
jgi:hypothetical protein